MTVCLPVWAPEWTGEQTRAPRGAAALGVMCGGGAGVTEEERCGARLQIRPLILRLSSFCCERPQPAPPDKRNEPQTPQFRHLLEGKLGPDDVLPACPSPRAPHSVQAHTCPGLWVVVVAGVEVGQRRGRFLDQLFSSEHMEFLPRLLCSRLLPRPLSPGHTYGIHGRETPPT